MGDYAVGNCPRCGQLKLTGSADAIIGNDDATRNLNRALLSHEVREATNAGKLFIITSDVLARYMARDAKLPDPQEQANNLILWIGDNQPSYDALAEIDHAALAATLGTAIGTRGIVEGTIPEPGVAWLFGELASEGLFSAGPAKRPNSIALGLTMKGWERYNELRRRVVNSHRAFMAMKFGHPILDRVLAQCFKPAVQRAGFELRALNEEQGAGLIDDQMRAAIRTARFLIADLTHDNNGAYFEAGFAEGLGLPVIYTCERAKFEKDKTHFDTNHMVTVPWQEDALEDAGRRLTATIRATLPAEATMQDQS